MHSLQGGLGSAIEERGRSKQNKVYVTLKAWFGHGLVLANRTKQVIKTNFGKHATMNGIIMGAWMRKKKKKHVYVIYESEQRIKMKKSLSFVTDGVGINRNIIFVGKAKH